MLPGVGTPGVLSSTTLGSEVGAGDCRDGFGGGWDGPEGT